MKQAGAKESCEGRFDDKGGDFFLREEIMKGGTRLTRASNYIKASENILIPIFNRYANKTLREKWKRWRRRSLLNHVQKGHRDCRQQDGQDPDDL